MNSCPVPSAGGEEQPRGIDRCPHRSIVMGRMAMKATSVLETALYVTDLAVATEFYTRVVGLTLHAEVAGRHVFLRCGSSMVLLFDPAQTERADVSGVPTHGARGPGHVAWRVTGEELPAWREWLRACGVPIEQEVVWPRGGHSLYFRDPSGNSLELATAEVWS